MAAMATTALVMGLAGLGGTAGAAGSAPTPASPSRVIGHGVHAYTLTGYGLDVDGATSLPTAAGCSTVETGSGAALAAIAVTVTAGSTRAKVSIGSSDWSISEGKRFTTVDWVPLVTGGFNACLPSTLASTNLLLLANTITTSSTDPGGLVELSARMRLATGTGFTGTLTFPDASTAPNAAGVLLQVSARISGVVQLVAGSAKVAVVVGKGVPAETIVLPGTTVTWSSTFGASPTVLLLGSVTQPTNDVTGGSQINLLGTPLSASGATIGVAGTDGIPALDSQVPPTGILADIQGSDPKVEDALAAGRQTPSGAAKSRATESVFRLGNDGALHLSTTATVKVVAWLGGDVVYGPSTINLTLPGAPQPTSSPAENELAFSGGAGFEPGETLILGVTPFTPTGAIDVVDSVATDGGTTVVTVTQGGLLSAFNSLNLVAQVQGGHSASTASPMFTRPSTIVPDLSESHSLYFHVAKSFSLGSDPSITAQVTFSFAPSLTVAINVNWGWSASVSIYYALDTTTKVGASLTARASWTGSSDIPLGTLYSSAFELGPVVVVPELSSTLNMSAGVSGSVTLAGAITEHSHDGFTVTAGLGRGISWRGDSNNGFSAPKLSGQSPEVSIGASAEAKLSMSFTLAVYGLAGPYAEASADIGLSVNPLSTPVWKVTAGADFTVGINLDVLRIPDLDEILQLLGIPSSPHWALAHLSYVVAQGGTPGTPRTGDTGTTGPVGGTTGGGGTGSGSGGPTGGGTGSGTYSTAPGGANATVSQGAPAPYGYRYLVTLTGFTPNSKVSVECYDTQDPDGFYWFALTVNSAGDASTQAYCYSAAGPKYWVVAGGLRSNTAEWGGSAASTGASIAIGWSGAHPGWITMTVSGFPAKSYTYTCNFGSGTDHSYPISISDSPETFDNGETCYDLDAGDTVWVTIGSVTSNTITVGGKISSSQGYTETTGGVTNTWSNYSDAGGTQGPTIASNTTLLVTCAIQGFKVADGNTWWYQIESSPWSDVYYASADAFYNDGQTTGSLLGTPFVDSAVPQCSSGPPPSASISIGWGSTPAPSGDWMDITFTNFPVGSVSWYCVEEGTDYGPYSTTLTSSTETLTDDTCYDTTPGGHDYVTADGIDSNTIASDSSPPPPTKSISIGWGSIPAPSGHWMDITFTNFPVGSVSWYCVEEGTDYGPYSTTLTSSTETLTDNTCYDTTPGGHDYVTADGVDSNTIASD